MVSQFTADPPLSPELVLVLPPELRAEAIADLGPPDWPVPRQPVAGAPAARTGAARELGTMLLVRVIGLALIFVGMTALTLILSAVAGAVR